MINIGMLIRHIIIGIIFSLFLGLKGFVAGFVISWLIPYAIKHLDQESSVFQHDNSSPDNDRYSQVNMDMKLQHFFSITFEVLGHVVKAKGVVTDLDIQLAESLMDKMHLYDDKRTAAQRSFNQGKQASYPLKQRLRLLLTYYGREPALLNFFVETQINAACTDGQLHPNELTILRAIASELRIDAFVFEQHLRAVQANFFFRQKGQGHRGKGEDYQYYRSSKQRSEQQTSYDYSEQNELENAFKALGLTKVAQAPEIKQAYRKLMNEHHPDKLVSKGLPPEMMDLAKQRTQEIQAAYELIKTTKGFK